MRLIILFLFSIFLSLEVNSQSASILIDGYFDDWTSNLITWNDPNEGNDVDIISVQVTNDENYLYLHIQLNSDIQLMSNLLPHNLFLYIDSDNNSNTGFNPQSNYGSEIGINFKQRFAYYNVVPFSTVSLNEANITAAPAVTNNEFEIAINRNVIPDGINPLFSSNTIKIAFQESSDGDFLPDNGQVFSYTFDDTPTAVFTPIDLNKSSTDFIRILAYNTLFDGITDTNLQSEYVRILQAINPDIIGFSECVSSTVNQVKSRLDSWLPLFNTAGWYVIKDDYDLITASQWPFLESWQEMDRQFPTLIDLPSSFDENLLFTNSHLKCCDGNTQRQMQVDEYAAFIRDIKIEGGAFILEENTPIIYAGDLNLVGFNSQLQTLITGIIQNSGQFGAGTPLDWDASNNLDIVPVHSDNNFSFTWQDESSDYTPSRIDYFIVSDAVINVEKAFVLNTQEMSQNRLDLYNLETNDTYYSSDHYPIIMDFSLIENVSISENSVINTTIYPNPSTGNFTINMKKSVANGLLNITNSIGEIVYTKLITNGSYIQMNTELSAGFYIVSIIDQQQAYQSILIIK